ncbi:MAG: hypothetical protein K2P99_02850 [Burkholderiales bacterium]|nr:hypothetical protein [Burkholderiales bacterium]
MRKLLLVLCTIGSISFSFANQIDNGTYQGYLQQDSFGQDVATGTSMNDSVNINIPKLTALNATNGVLTGTLNGNLNTKPDANCIDNTNFSATKLGMKIVASSVTLTNCTYKNNVLRGNFDAVLFGLFHNKGVFNFTYQGQ